MTYKVIAKVIDETGEVFDECYTWEAAQNYALHEGMRIVAVADDGFMSRDDIQQLCDSELRRYNDCWNREDDGR
jgi:hypothetical protein